jgi:RNA polymerase sigma factor (TIGR02999 family)
MADQPATGSVAQLMASFRKGDKAAAGRLVEIFYPELRRLATARMRSERLDHTLQATALINELYLELLKVKDLRESDSNDEEERTAFLRFAGHLMKRLLIHHARPLSKQQQKVELADVIPGSDGTENIAEIDEALNRLAAINPQIRTVVELRVFEGLTGDEIAARLGCGSATVTRHWNFARHWLTENFAPDTGQ